MAKFPRRHGFRCAPQANCGRPRDSFGVGNRWIGQIAGIGPSEAGVDLVQAGVGASTAHAGECPVVAVDAARNHVGELAVAQSGEGAAGCGAEGLAPLRCVDFREPDVAGTGCASGYDGVAINDSGDAAGFGQCAGDYRKTAKASKSTTTRTSHHALCCRSEVGSRESRLCTWLNPVPGMLVVRRFLPPRRLREAPRGPMLVDMPVLLRLIRTPGSSLIDLRNRMAMASLSLVHASAIRGESVTTAARAVVDLGGVARALRRRR